MMGPASRVMNEYRTLVVKMFEDKDDLKPANTSFKHLINVRIVISLAMFTVSLKVDVPCPLYFFHILIN
jgi:hypothetical protein